MPPTAPKHGKTEYQQNFKKSRFACSAATYRSNLDFRTEQKRRFVEHDRGPFCWDPDDIESDSNSDCSCDGESNRPSAMTLTRYKHEKLNRLYERKMTGNEKTKKNVVIDAIPSDGCSYEDSEESGSGSDSESCTECDSDVSSVVHVIEPKFENEERKKREIVGRAKTPKRVASKQTQTDRERERTKASKPAPFAPYGCWADVKETGKKMTHNVLASQQVYPSALRAQRMRTSLIDDYSSGSPSRTSVRSANRISDRSRPPSSNDPVQPVICADDGETREWMSEYDRNFRAHSPNYYRSRPNSARVESRDLVPQVLCRNQQRRDTR